MKAIRNHGHVACHFGGPDKSPEKKFHQVTLKPMAVTELSDEQFESCEGKVKQYFQLEVLEKMCDGPDSACEVGDESKFKSQKKRVKALKEAADLKPLNE